MNDATTPGGEGRVTVGLDLGDKHTQLCMIAADGELLEEARLRTTPAALRRRFAALPVARLVLEAGTHSPSCQPSPRRLRSRGLAWPIRASCA